MLPLLHRVRRKFAPKHIYLAQLVFFSTVCHTVLLGVLCISYCRALPYRMVIAADKRSSPARVLVVSDDQFVHLQKQQVQPQKVSSRTVVPARRTVIGSQPAATKKSVPRPAPQQPAKKQPKPQPVSASHLPIKKVENHKPNLKKSEALPVNVEAMAEADPVIYVPQSQSDMAMVQQQVYRLVHAAWQIPVGLGAGVRCCVRFNVGSTGMVKDIVMKESSHVLMFDVSVRGAIARVQFPTVAHNKEFEIVFQT